MEKPPTARADPCPICANPDLKPARSVSKTGLDRFAFICPCGLCTNWSHYSEEELIRYWNDRKTVYEKPVKITVNPEAGIPEEDRIDDMTLKVR